MPGWDQILRRERDRPATKICSHCGVDETTRDRLPNVPDGLLGCHFSGSSSRSKNQTCILIKQPPRVHKVALNVIICNRETSGAHCYLSKKSCGVGVPLQAHQGPGCVCAQVPTLAHKVHYLIIVVHSGPRGVPNRDAPINNQQASIGGFTTCLLLMGLSDRAAS